MKKILLTTLFAMTGIFALSAMAYAETPSSMPPADVAKLQQQVAELMKQIETLKMHAQVQSTEIKDLREELRLTRRLKQGSSGDDVRLLQELLSTDPEIYPEGKVTGTFGPLTGKALKRFQEKHDLEGVGEAGPKTLELLNRFMREGGAGKSGKIPKGLLQKARMQVMVPLLPQNNSGLKGYAKIADNKDGKAVVMIEMLKWGNVRDDATTTRPAHIHEGACPTPGAVKHALTGLLSGKSSTTLTVSTKELLAGVPLAINVHKSADEAGAYVACGDIKLPALMKKDSDDDDDEDEDDHDKKKHNEDADDVRERLLKEKRAEELRMNQGTTTSGKFEGGKRVIELYAGNFSYSTNEIRVKLGEPVKVVLKVKEGFHDMVSDAVGLRTGQVSAGETTTGTFTPQTLGVHEFYCSVGSHKAMGMVGKIIVE